MSFSNRNFIKEGLASILRISLGGIVSGRNFILFNWVLIVNLSILNHFTNKDFS